VLPLYEDDSLIYMESISSLLAISFACLSKFCSRFESSFFASLSCEVKVATSLIFLTNDVFNIVYLAFLP